MSIPPGAPQPSYILRGHATPVHVAKFIRGNTRLVTGDAEGWVVVWSLETRRAAAAWRAHEGVLLAVGEWGGERVVTHGKDNKLIIWKLPTSDENSMSKVPPVDIVSEERRKPWVLHMLDVNTMNFCGFALCPMNTEIEAHDLGETGEEREEMKEEESLIAVPNTLTSESIDIFHIPTLQRLHNIPSPGPNKPGMIMCLELFLHPITKCLTVISGYEDGSVSVFSLAPHIPSSSSVFASPSASSPQWNTIYQSKSHIQPVLSLSLDPSPDRKFFITSGADDRIIKYLIPTTTTPISTSTSRSKSRLAPSNPEPKILKTAHAGQQSIQIRNDGKIAATAGWDGRARVYGVGKMRELAVLKWHKEGCFAAAVADVLNGEKEEEGQAVSGDAKGKELVGRLGQLDVKGERLRKARETHWVAVGGKDGKVSLWDVLKTSYRFVYFAYYKRATGNAYYLVEAVSGVPFPIQSNLCTRFPTELILRKTTEVGVIISIVAHQSCSDVEKLTLGSLNEKLDNLHELPTLIENAKAVMGVSSDGKAFSKHILKIEVSGPDHPHLTIVDFPGLIHSETKQQSSADAALVKDAVRTYMSQQRSIILAVVSAKNDYANQTVLSLARAADKEGTRTLGVNTKPDTLLTGSGSEAMHIALAKNQNLEFRLGWHVLKNMGSETGNFSLADRTLEEEQYFSQDAWQALSRSILGIEALRHRLGHVLLHQIVLELPSLVKDIEIKSDGFQDQLEKLGQPRASLEIKKYGTYNDPFFGDALSLGYGKRIRAVVQNSNIEFAERMTGFGHTDAIGEPSTLAKPSRDIPPNYIAKDEFIDLVQILMERTQENLQKARNQRSRDACTQIVKYFFGVSTLEAPVYLSDAMDLNKLVTALVDRTEPDMNHFACSEAMDCMQAYCKVALKRFIDDVAVEVIEEKLIYPLGDMFSPRFVAGMKPELVTLIAGEYEENRTERDQLKVQLDVLSKGLDTCKHFIGVGGLVTNTPTHESNSLSPLIDREAGEIPSEKNSDTECFELLVETEPILDNGSIECAPDKESPPPPDNSFSGVIESSSHDLVSWEFSHSLSKKGLKKKRHGKLKSVA
ncbi:hypothetical protein EYC80_001856 [Monilinia laxa]|uniref:ASTRA-associated protein 1 n=1 Tax=Monilinia laxa TaxID=61186 RepID=A0A5N6K692_MONLA|nr:hypothetical protein EYC80_001856 [Monilinia laxa]